MRKPRNLLLFLAVLLVAPALPAGSGAHVEVSPDRVPAGVGTAGIQASGGGSEPENPAPAVARTSSATAPVSAATGDQTTDSAPGARGTGEPTATDADPDDSSSEDKGGDGRSLLLIIVAGLAIGTFAGLIVRARRKR